jgi:hypothetical protein
VELSFKADVLVAVEIAEEAKMGRGLLLWLIGIPIPIILLIWLFGGLHGWSTSWIKSQRAGSPRVPALRYGLNPETSDRGFVEINRVREAIKSENVHRGMIRRGPAGQMAVHRAVSWDKARDANPSPAASGSASNGGKNWDRRATLGNGTAFSAMAPW